MPSIFEMQCRTLVDESDDIRRVERQAVMAAASQANVLISGEADLCNSLVARFIHDRSVRSTRGFAALPCREYQGLLFESKLFGHLRGSFPGAYQTRFGLLHTVPGGTIYIDDVSALSESTQALLLRFLETGEYLPVGGDRLHVAPDVRLIASTTVSLQAMINAGLFLPALLHRLNIVSVSVPLRERRTVVH